MQNSHQKSKIKIAIYLIAVISCILVYAISFERELIQIGDAPCYMTLGISLAKGEGLHDISVPGTPSLMWWPAGFPAFIGVFYKIFGAHWTLLRLIIFIGLYAAFALFIKNIYEKDKNILNAILLLLVLCFSSAIHMMSSFLYSETFYVTISLLFFFIWHKWQDNLTLKRIIILSLLAVYIGSVRNIGITLSVAFGFYILLAPKNLKTWKSRWYTAIPFGILTLYVIAIQIIPQVKGNQFEYFFQANTSSITSHGTTEPSLINKIYNFLHLYFDRFMYSLRGYGLSLIPQVLIRSIYDLHAMTKTKALFMVIISAFVIKGWFSTVKNYTLMNVYTALFIAGLFLYGPLYDRLLVPIVPFLLLYFYNGIKDTCFILLKNQKTALSVFIILWGIVILSNAFLTFTNPHKYIPVTFGDQHYQHCIEWVIKNAKHGDVVVSQIHPYMYVRRGAYNIPFTSVPDTSEFLSFLGKFKAKYLVVSSFYQRPGETYMDIVYKTEKECPLYFKKVCGFGNDSTYVLEYLKTSEK